MNEGYKPRIAVLQMGMSQFWSADLGLTLVTISVAALVFVVTPLREAGLPARVFFDTFVVALMISGALVVKQNRIFVILVIAVLAGTAVVLTLARLHPTPSLRILASALVTVTLLLYIRIVLLVMFRGGPVTWSRIQGGVCAYLLLGMAWASSFQLLEELRPGSFQFVTTPLGLDQLSSKLTYYSFATLTTVGSDISPVSPFARSLTTAEAVTGQLFPAILIATLVAMAMQSHTKT
jgi:hypothetical protein